MSYECVKLSESLPCSAIRLLVGRNLSQQGETGIPVDMVPGSFCFTVPQATNNLGGGLETAVLPATVN